MTTNTQTQPPRSVLVTGASRGIGRAIALRAAADGFIVIVHYRQSQDAATSLLKEIEAAGGQGRLLRFDISEREAAQEALSQDIAEHGVYYGVVCNAGVNQDNAFPSLTGEAWDHVVRTNLDGFYNVLHPIVMPMVRAKRGGRIVTLSSVSGQIGNRGQVNYSAAKAGIIGATKSLALELAKRAITVNCVSPGLIETDMIEGLRVEEAMKMIPARRLGKPEEVAALVSFLLSDDAGYITRQVFGINGGMA